MGTPDFAVPCLRALIEGPDEVVAVVTNPDRPAGRGKAQAPPPIKVAALDAEIPVHQPTSVRSPGFLEWFTAQRPDRAIVVAYGRILPQSVLDVPTHGCINVHASILPRLRGAAPINWAIVRGEAQTGVCIMQMEAGLDSGPVYLVDSVNIAPGETAGELHDRLMSLGALSLRRALDGIHHDGLTAVRQDDAGSTDAPMMTKADGDIDWTGRSAEIVGRIHGFNPWPGAWTTIRCDTIPKLDGARLKVHRARTVAGTRSPGVCDVEGMALTVGTREGLVEVLSLQAPGRRPVSAQDFVRGFPLAGARLIHTSAL
jgi:methionyl-tRNA formyltransferase